MKAKAWFDNVKGVPMEAIRHRFPRCPKSLTESYCENNLWWWHGLENLTHGQLRGWDKNAKPHAGLVRHLHQTRMPLLALMNNMGAMEEWLSECEAAEWTARLEGSNLPPPPPLTFWNDYHARMSKTPSFSLCGVTVYATDSEKDVSDRVSAHLALAGWTPGKGVFRRPSRTSGRESWAAMFRAIEAVDRYYLLHQELDDSLRRAITNRLNRTPTKKIGSQTTRTKGGMIRTLRLIRNDAETV